MVDEVDAWIPSLSAARSAKTSMPVKLFFGRAVNLLDRDPIATRRLAAIVLVANREGEPENPILRYPYVPTMPFALEEGTVRVLERYATNAPPACLRVSIERRASGDPYRGMPTSDPTFHGFDYADALAQVRHRVAVLRAEWANVPIEIHTFAWPILRLTFRTLVRRQEMAVVVRPDGVLHAMLIRGSLF